MYKVTKVRKGKKYIYLEIEDSEWVYSRKITFSAYNLGIKFNNHDFIMIASKKVDFRDWNDSWNAVDCVVGQ